MSTLREAAQQFVADYENGDLGDLKHYARALRAALAQQTQTRCDIAEDGVCEVIDCCRNPTQEEQEPVAWSPSLTYPNYEKERVWLNGKPRQEDVEYWSENGNGITYVYNHPPRREWRSLSEEDFDRICDNHATLQGAARAIEAKLKEKNQ